MIVLLSQLKTKHTRRHKITLAWQVSKIKTCYCSYTEDLCYFSHALRYGWHISDRSSILGQRLSVRTCQSNQNGSISSNRAQRRDGEGFKKENRNAKDQMKIMHLRQSHYTTVNIQTLILWRQIYSQSQMDATWSLQNKNQGWRSRTHIEKKSFLPYIWP